jgi:hypothetical protein
MTNRDITPSVIERRAPINALTSRCMIAVSFQKTRPDLGRQVEGESGGKNVCCDRDDEEKEEDLRDGF